MFRTSASSNWHGKPLSESDIKSVVNYVSKLDNDAGEITQTLAVNAAGML